MNDYICTDCFTFFAEPETRRECMDPSQNAWETFSRCPDCGGEYDEAYLPVLIQAAVDLHERIRTEKTNQPQADHMALHDILERLHELEVG